MRRFFLGTLAALCLGLPATAQEDLPESVFRDYAHMREVLDGLMMQREIADVMRAFGASDEMTAEELDSLQNRVRAIFPSDFGQVSLVKRDEMGDGWAREMYAYWGGLSYIFASVVFHQREEALVAVKFKFNTDINALLTEF